MNSTATNPENEFALPHDEYSQVFLKYFEGYSHEEIAASLNLPVSTVKERLKKGKQRISVSFRIFTKRFLTSVKNSKNYGNQYSITKRA
jgi:DNA-binding transcriptional regulator LsrR (DeoR family)